METAEEFAARLVTHLADTLIASRMSPREAKAHAIALIEADRAAVALSILRELEALAKTKKWVAAGELSKEAAWGRAYGQAMGELLAKYMQGVKSDGA